MITVRNYNPNTDYPSVEALYKDSSTFGGRFDADRDSEQRLHDLSRQKLGSIIVAEDNSRIVGTVSLVEDSRSAWLFRFAVQKENEEEIAKKLKERAFETLKEFGHTQVVVYVPTGDAKLNERYQKLGLTAGGNYTAYWEKII